MCAHPLMPLYLTGGQDGSVQMWEWGHQQVVCTPRPPGTFAKVTRCRFSQHGNKFGIADGDGNLSLWQVGLASQSNRPFFVSLNRKGDVLSVQYNNFFLWFWIHRLINVITRALLILYSSVPAAWWQRAVIVQKVKM